MKKELKKLFFLIFLILIFFLLILIWQIKKNQAMDTNYSDRPLIENISINIPLEKDEPVFGNRGSLVTVTEFIDLNKKEDLTLHEKIKNFVARHPKDIRLVWKDFPAQSFWGKDLNKTHRAALCVAEQNQVNFWSFIDELSATKNPNDEAALLSLGEKYVENQDAWKTCVSKQETEQKILNSISFVNSLGLKKSPVIFINNRLVNYVDEINMDDLLEQIITPLPNN